jgi:hypothetical protein
VTAELEPVGSVSGHAKGGLWKDLPGTFSVAPDFNAPLAEFRDYME